MGFAETVLWVLPANARARRFYEAAGWVADGAERTSEVFGVTVPEVRYRRRSTSAAISSATPAGTE
jgi:RimJ/RimL family protein N-acetyltransferase